MAPNVVPDEARLWLTAREVTTPKVDAIAEWLSQLAEGVALGTQTKAHFNLELGCAEMIPNETLALRVFEHLQHVPLDWSAEEQAFAKSCQKEMNLREDGLATTIMPFVKELKVGGSSDVADVSWNAPVALFGWPTHPLGVSAHTWAVTACGGMSIGDKASIAAATILAAIGFDLMTERELRQTAKEELIRRLDGRQYKAVQNIDTTTWDETSRRFGKGPGEEALSGIDQ